MKKKVYHIRAPFLPASRCTLHVSRGFTLLLAVLMGSLLFSMGLAIANLTLKELTLSSAARESEKAFYAADSGTECALYWDIQRKAFQGAAKGERSSISCNGTSDIKVTPVSANDPKNPKEYTFRLPLSQVATFACADVRVIKDKDHTSKEITVIESRGRNDCEDTDNPGRVERALRVRY
ncbi:MAG: hypothetical protein Greene041679_483 [Parcubacteria group bacterium Greene0416_79]|nr:MAG: hypothetical protein Greene041679_483 [Parcubacteria group bacterium Greene0416_79]